MKRYVLDNGLRVLEEEIPSESVTVQVTVEVGSNYERDGIRGISHFIEHLLFEGTKKRKDAGVIANEIESLGGEINAFTDNVRTCYFVKVPKEHFEIALDILSDMLICPLFRKRDVAKERNVILKEINIFTDETRFYQWTLFEQAMFRNNPARFPVLGTIEDMNKISQADIIRYFRHHYTALNASLCIAGGVKSAKKMIDSYFGKMGSGIRNVLPSFPEPEERMERIVTEKRKLTNSYFVLGYKSPPRNLQESYALDVIQSILGRGQSGRIFDEIRNKRGLSYEVGVTHHPSKGYGYFAVYLSCEKKNIPLIRQLISKEIRNLSRISEKQLKEAKGFLKGQFILNKEDTQFRADSLSFWESVGDAALAEKYLGKIDAVSRAEVKKVAERYFRSATIAIVEQE